MPSVTLLSGEGKNYICSSWPHWVYNMERQDQHMWSIRIIAKDHVQLSARVNTYHGQGSRWQKHSGNSRIRAAYKGSGTLLWEVEWLTLPTVTVYAKVSNKLLLISPVDIFNLCRFGPPNFMSHCWPLSLWHIFFCSFQVPFLLVLEVGETQNFNLRPHFHLFLHTLSNLVHSQNLRYQVILQHSILFWDGDAGRQIR